MHPPIFVRGLRDAERARLEASLRSASAFTVRRARIVLRSASGRTPREIARGLCCASRTVRDAIRAVSIPRQSRGHYGVSRSKRLFGDADAAPASGPPEGGGHRQRFSCSSRASSFSCRLMYSRIVSSSRPTVDTKYPLAQKCWPVKFLFRSP